MTALAFPDKNNWEHSDYITLVHASVAGKFDPLHWCQFAYIESGLKASRPIPLIRNGTGPFAYNKSGGAAGLFQAMPEIQKALGFKPGALDYELAKGDFRELSISEQIVYSRKYLDEWRTRFNLRSWDRAGDIYVAIFWPAGLKHKDEPEFIIVDKKKLPKTYTVNAGLDSSNKGWINILDMSLAANRALGSGIFQTAQKSLISLAQSVLGVDPDGIKGPMTEQALVVKTGSRNLDKAAWAILAPSLQ